MTEENVSGIAVPETTTISNTNNDVKANITIVYVSTDLCGACQTFEPIFLSLKWLYRENIKFYSIKKMENDNNKLVYDPAELTADEKKMLSEHLSKCKSVPYVTINGKKIDDAYNYSINDFQEIINPLIKRFTIDNINSELAKGAEVQEYIESNKTFVYIDWYVNWASKISIAPKEYHTAVALSHLSAIVDRNVYIPFSWQRIYPNLWINILGKTRVSKKSTATEVIGKEKIFDEVNKNSLFPCLLPSDITPPKLFEILAERAKEGGGSKGFMLIDEIGGFFSKLSKADYMEGGKDFLCKIYGCTKHDEKATKKDGTLRIEDAYLTILGNTTHERLSRAISIDDFLSGFLPRFLFFDAPIPENDYKTGYETIETEMERRQLVKCLNDIKKQLDLCNIQYMLSEDANKEYIDYQKYIDALIIKDNKYWLGELPNQLIKLAILIEISNNILFVDNVYFVGNVYSVYNVGKSVVLYKTGTISKNSILKARSILINCFQTLTDSVDKIDIQTKDEFTDKVYEKLNAATSPMKPRDFRNVYKSTIPRIKEALDKLIDMELVKKTDKGYIKT